MQLQGVFRNRSSHTTWHRLDSETRGHSYRVASLAGEFAEHINDGLDIKRIIKAGMWHDIGKSLIPRNVLLFPGKLMDRDFELVRTHVTKGMQFSEHWDFDEVISQVVLYHHERYDGHGYVSGVPSKELPIEVRLMTLVDSFDAMAHNRVYHSSLSITDALLEIQKGAGTQFDPELAQCFIDWQGQRRSEVVS